MNSGDKMEPFLASEMAWVCQMIFLTTATFIVYQFYSIYNETSK